MYPINNYESINIVLQDIQKKKDELMLVLSRPETSLHNNDSERDIRELAKRRKISSGTRSENGKMSRDTFLSIKKTCRKLNISFWEYLNDRFSLKNTIDQLNIIMIRQSSPSG
ncbi:MAG: transposase [Saprospiraceae bacterium]|nr:transposase [Saprospiraceae bacterium]